MPATWSKIDLFGLAFCVDRNARELLPLTLNTADLQSDPDGKRLIAEKIYNALCAQQIEYALEPPTSSRHQDTQQIRLPQDILKVVHREGTCLDLALLFCGLCLGYELLPILIVLKGHALVAVSQLYTLRDRHRRGIREHDLFQNALVFKENRENRDLLAELLSDGSYLAIECTGFAHSSRYLQLQPSDPLGIGREADGAMTFTRALAAAEEVLKPNSQRPFSFALDIPVAHEALTNEFGQFTRQIASSNLTADGDEGPLPYLIDRSDQEQALIKAAMRHRALGSTRPLICLIHGDEYECHREFVERIQRISIPQRLPCPNPNEKQDGLLKYLVHLPSFERAADREWDDQFWRHLAAATIKIEPSAWDENSDPGTRRQEIDAVQQKVIEFVSHGASSVIIEARLLSELLEQDLEKRIDALVNFWRAWPDMPKDFLLVVCLSFKYQKQFEEGVFQRMLRWPKGLNSRIRSHLESDRSQEENRSVVCLPELRSIKQSDAEDAVNSELVRVRYGLTENDVRAVYLAARNRLVSMDNLVDQLLRRHREKKYA